MSRVQRFHCRSGIFDLEKDDLAGVCGPERGAGSSGGVLDIIDELHSNSDLARSVLGNDAIKTMVQNYPPHHLPATQDWQNAYQRLRDCFANGVFDSYLSAAMLFRGYISDHLPLFQTFTR